MIYEIFFINNKYNFLTPLFMIDKKTYFLLDFIVIFLTVLAIKNHNYYDKYCIIIYIINIIFELLYNIFMFIFPSPFLIFSSKLLQFIFSINLNEIIYTNKKSAKLLIPYILWNFILTLISVIILFLNI